MSILQSLKNYGSNLSSFGKVQPPKPLQISQDFWANPQLQTFAGTTQTKTTTPTAGVSSLSSQPLAQTPQMSAMRGMQSLEPTLQRPPTPPAQPSFIQTSQGQREMIPLDQLTAQNQARQQALQSPSIGLPPQQPQQPQTQVASAPQQPQQPSRIDTLRETLLSSFQPTEQETALQRQVADLNAQAQKLAASEALGLEQIEGQAIPMNFITGQQAGLQRQASAQLRALEAQQRPLLDQLAMVQAQRETSAQRAQAELEFEQKQAQAGMGEIREFGGQLVRVMPDGRVETLAEAPTTAEQFTLSPGQIRFDSQGNVVAQGAINPTEQLQLQKLQLDIFKTQQELAMSGQQLTPQQLQDAINKGYTDEKSLKFYSQLVQGGAVPPHQSARLVESTIEQARKMAEDSQDALNALDRLSILTRGSGMASSSARLKASTVPGTAAFEVAEAIKSLESNLGIDSLLRIKESGAGLGQVPQSQLETLQKLMGNLNVARDPAILKRDIQNIQNIYSNIQRNLEQDLGRQIQQNQQNPFMGGELSNPFGFSKVGGDTNIASIRDGSRVTTSLGQGVATGITNGSPLWKWGFDIQLQGGKGAPVVLPPQLAGAVVKSVVGNYSNPTNSPLASAVGKSQNRGLGNQVVVQLPNGDELWFSHLDRVNNLKPGTVLSPNTILGLQGNTGNTLGKTGVHVDITGRRKDGSYYTSQQVASLLGTKLA